MCVHNTCYICSVLRKCSFCLLIEKWKLYRTVIYISILLYDLFHLYDELIEFRPMFLVIKKNYFLFYHKFHITKSVIFNINIKNYNFHRVSLFELFTELNVFQIVTWLPSRACFICIWFATQQPYPTPCLHCVYDFEKMLCEMSVRSRYEQKT